MYMKKIKYAIFDFDGTLADSIGGITKAVNETAKEEKIDKSYTREEVTKFVGNGAKVLFMRAFNVTEFDSKTTKLYELFMNYYALYQLKEIEIYPNINDLLLYLNNNDVNIIIYSNKPYDILVDCMANLFKEVKILKCFGYNNEFVAKPKIDGIMKYFSLNNYDINEAIYVGDSPVDVKFAKALNIPSVACLYGYGDLKLIKEENPTYSVKSGKELLQLFKAIL